MVLREALRSQDSPCAKCGGKGRPSVARDTAPDWARRVLSPHPCPSCAGTGLTLRPRVELAAYCGDEAAAAVIPTRVWTDAHAKGLIPPQGVVLVSPELPDWVTRLSRWGPSVMDRAAVAAARVALPTHERRLGETCMCGDGINGCYNHNFTHMCDYRGLPECECPPTPAPEARRAIEAAEHVLHGEEGSEPYEHQRMWDEGWARGWRTQPWLPAPWASDGARVAEILAAARLAGEKPVRDAISKALIEWALGGSA